MKKTVLRYGLYSAAFMVVFFLAKFAMMDKGDTPDYKSQEVYGYAGMILSLLFVFAGIKYYRDRVNGGSISFGKAMKLGLLITLVPAIAFGLFNGIYVEAIDPQFFDKYLAYSLTEMKKTVSEAEFAAKSKELTSQMDMFRNPIISSLVMAVTVYLIGVVITVLSSLILKRKVKMVM